MENLKEKFKSVRLKLFLSFGVVVISIILLLIMLNNVVLESFYLYSKQNTLKEVYKQINNYYNTDNSNVKLEDELEKVAISNNFDILIKSDQNTSVYTSNKDFIMTLGEMTEMVTKSEFRNTEVLESTSKYQIKKMKDTNNDISYILLAASLDNGYLLYIRIPLTSIQESVRISNKFLYWIGGVSIIFGGIVVSLIARKFTKPILELNDIAKKMSNLDFSQKYQVTESEDEIQDLGKSINIMSDKLEKTINQLRNSNIELERDIEEKSKIDEMRKSFISDVSHELKTPIALIQGYSEGLLENVNSDEESRKFYAEVILDESNKMDKLVKQLLELMKLEYGKREFNNKQFDIIELEKEVLRKSKVMLEEKNIEVEMDETQSIKVFADDFYIEQVITNYITNAIKNAEKIDNKKAIKIQNEVDTNLNKVRIKVFNTGKNINKENENRIWNRFYKADESRNREDGGSGIGLSIVKAIMTNYKTDFGFENLYNGVEFYFDLNLKEKAN